MDALVGIGTVLFGLMVCGWMFKAYFPKTHQKVSDKLDEINKD